MTANRRWLLAIDTATATIIVAAGSTDGELLAEEAFEGRYRHSQELLPAIVRLTERAGLRIADLAGIVTGTGPGAFTGLRVGLATAKTLAHELGCPIVGISTGEALLAVGDGRGGSGGGAVVLWLPSGARDKVVVELGVAPRVVRGSADHAGADQAGAAEHPAADGDAIAVDLDGRASEAALARGRVAVAGLGAALLRLGAARLARGEADDPELLVPSYASPPRGMPTDGPSDERGGGVAWSRDPR